MKKYKLILQKTEFYEVFTEAEDMDGAKDFGKVFAWDDVDYNRPVHAEYRVYDIVQEEIPSIDVSKCEAKEGDEDSFSNLGS